MINDVIQLWMAAFPLMGSPGPATISLAGIGTGFGFRKGQPYLLGIILGTFGVLVLIATGITALILAEPALKNALTMVSLAYIVYLAWKIATAPMIVSDLSNRHVPSLASGFVLAIANPKAFAAIGAVYASHTLFANGFLGDSISKIAALSIVIVIVNTGWLWIGSAFSSILRDPGLGRIANIAFAVMLLASVILALIST